MRWALLLLLVVGSCYARDCGPECRAVCQKTEGQTGYIHEEYNETEIIKRCVCVPSQLGSQDR